MNRKKIPPLRFSDETQQSPRPSISSSLLIWPTSRYIREKQFNALKSQNNRKPMQSAALVQPGRHPFDFRCNLFTIKEPPNEKHAQEQFTDRGSESKGTLNYMHLYSLLVFQRLQNVVHTSKCTSH